MAFYEEIFDCLPVILPTIDFCVDFSPDYNKPVRHISNSHEKNIFFIPVDPGFSNSNMVPSPLVRPYN